MKEVYTTTYLAEFKEYFNRTGVGEDGNIWGVLETQVEISPFEKGVVNFDTTADKESVSIVIETALRIVFIYKIDESVSMHSLEKHINY